MGIQKHAGKVRKNTIYADTSKEKRSQKFVSMQSFWSEKLQSWVKPQEEKTVVTLTEDTLSMVI